MKKKLTENPDRPCKVCGVVGQNLIIKIGAGRTIYSSKCPDCDYKRRKSIVHLVCRICKSDKESNNRPYCGSCYRDKYNRNNDNARSIQGPELVTVKKWVEKQIRFNFMTNLMGLNELITNYQLVSKSQSELDSYKSSDQFQMMWDIIWDMYNTDLKNIPDEILKSVTCDRTTRKLSKNVMKKVFDEDIQNEDSKMDKFMNDLESFEIDGKDYNFKEEYDKCILDNNHLACARFRKIIQTIKLDIKDLKIISLKHSKIKND